MGSCEVGKAEVNAGEFGKVEAGTSDINMVEANDGAMYFFNLTYT